jgi:hypothetical protein
VPGLLAGVEQDQFPSQALVLGDEEVLALGKFVVFAKVGAQLVLHVLEFVLDVVETEVDLSATDCLGARDSRRKLGQRSIRAISSTSAGRQTKTSAEGTARKASSQSSCAGVNVPLSAFNSATTRREPRNRISSGNPAGEWTLVQVWYLRQPKSLARSRTQPVSSFSVIHVARD